MAYQSVDQLQKVLAEDIFHYTKDAKKAAGRALGTLVEIITFYLLKSWGFENSIAIERPLPEYGNPAITHNVEYSLQPVLSRHEIEIVEKLPLSTRRIFAMLSGIHFSESEFHLYGNQLLSSGLVVRNSCTVARAKCTSLIANLISRGQDRAKIAIVEQHLKPYAMFECKRVGIEEGMRKGPQTIEKAKQGAYVAKAVSSLHKVRVASGELQGLIYRAGNLIYTKPYEDLLSEIVASQDADLLRDFVLTIGVVSNHGNWFTSDDHNKELKVLAQSYDWLVFLTDQGLSEFITELLLKPKPLLEPAKKAFLLSYTAGKKKNQFTKVSMEYEADQVLQSYFANNYQRVEDWFNVIAPSHWSMHELQSQLFRLRDKNWEEVHAI